VPSALNTSTRAFQPIAEANRCVACGLCLPACPTYRKTESEADSPRGRIMLMRALFEGALDPEPKLAVHLDRCLACRACEGACPSGVRYGQLIDAGRAELVRGGHRAAGPARWLAGLLTAQPLLALGRLRFGQRYAAQGERRGVVSLFLGCIGRLADAETLRAAIFVLTRLGYEVHVPRAQGCCGAMHQHGGEPARAGALARTNLAAFAAPTDGPGGETPILFSAAGCGASLVEYGRHGEQGAAFARRATDIVSFLTSAQGWESVAIAGLPETIAVHEPCSARNVLHSAADIYRLLARIPQARAAALSGNDQCCGSAGLYFLSQPEMAARLRADKMQAARGSSARYLVSTNHGCARWIAQGLPAGGLDIQVMHPVVLLAKQMGFTGTC
jgi:glycolate oxidase iron-sulfur subunit